MPAATGWSSAPTGESKKNPFLAFLALFPRVVPNSPSVPIRVIGGLFFIPNDTARREAGAHPNGFHRNGSDPAVPEK